MVTVTFNTVIQRGGLLSSVVEWQSKMASHCRINDLVSFILKMHFCNNVMTSNHLVF